MYTTVQRWSFTFLHLSWKNWVCTLSEKWLLSREQNILKNEGGPLKRKGWKHHIQKADVNSSPVDSDQPICDSVYSTFPACGLLSIRATCEGHFGKQETHFQGDHSSDELSQQTERRKQTLPESTARWGAAHLIEFGGGQSKQLGGVLRRRSVALQN